MLRRPLPLITAIACGCSAISSLPAAPVAYDFLLNTNLSRIGIAASVSGQTAVEQGPGSTNASYFGTVRALIDWDAGTLDILPSSALEGAPTGSWRPGPAGASDTSPAVYGIQASAGPITAYVAGRDVVGSLSNAAPLTLSGAGPVRTFDAEPSLYFSGGSLDYAATFGAMPGSEPLAELGAAVNAGGAGQLVQTNASVILRLPIDVTLPFEVSGQQGSARFQGVLVGAAPFSDSTGGVTTGGDGTGAGSTSGIGTSSTGTGATGGGTSSGQATAGGVSGAATGAGSGAGSSSAGGSSSGTGGSGAASTGASGSATGGGTGSALVLEWDIEIRRPREGKSVRFRAGKGIGSVKGLVRTDLPRKTGGVLVELAWSTNVASTNGALPSNGADAVWLAATRVSPANKRGIVKFVSKRFGAEGGLTSGVTATVWARASTNFDVGATEPVSRVVEIR